MKLDRTEHLEEIFNEIRKASKRDLRIGQLMECITPTDDDIFYIENDKLLERLREFNGN